MSKSAEFPHSTSGRLQPKGHKNSAKKKIWNLKLQPLFFYGYENKIL